MNPIIISIRALLLIEELHYYVSLRFSFML